MKPGKPGDKRFPIHLAIGEFTMTCEDGEETTGTITDTNRMDGGLVVMREHERTVCQFTEGQDQVSWSITPRTLSLSSADQGKIEINW